MHSTGIGIGFYVTHTLEKKLKLMPAKVRSEKEKQTNEKIGFILKLTKTQSNLNIYAWLRMHFRNSFLNFSRLHTAFSTNCNVRVSILPFIRYCRNYYGTLFSFTGESRNLFKKKNIHKTNVNIVLALYLLASWSSRSISKNCLTFGWMHFKLGRKRKKCGNCWERLSKYFCHW